MKSAIVHIPSRRNAFTALAHARYVARKEKTSFITAIAEGDVLLENMEHPLYGAAKRWAKAGLAADRVALEPIETGIESVGLDAINLALADVSDKVKSIHHIVAHVEDESGYICRQYTIECRTISSELLLNDDVEWGPMGWQLKGATGPLSINPTFVLPEAAILHQPISAKYFEAGNLQQAMDSAQDERTMLSQRIFRLAREKLEAREAFKAFEVLFNYYSNNEELWRLQQWMENFLPYKLEEAPEMKHYFELLKKQVGHIDDLTHFYANESPYTVVDDTYVRTAHFKLSPRYQWLVEECRKRGYKRVIELGSVDGISLFPLMQYAPDIEWHGAEVSKRAVEHGREVAARNNLGDRFHLHHVKALDRRHIGDLADSIGTFEAAFVSEVLEHNSPGEGSLILEAAAEAVRSRGHIFISTPNGNWSICDEKTRDVNLRKDHINAYTAQRMRKFLEEKTFAEPQTIEVKVVENPDFWEANSWLFASYQVG